MNVLLAMAILFISRTTGGAIRADIEGVFMENHFSELAASLPELIPATHLSRLLGGLYTTKYLANLRFLGTGPRYLKLRGRVFYRRADVLAWLEASTIDPATIEHLKSINPKPAKINELNAVSHLLRQS